MVIVAVVVVLASWISEMVSFTAIHPGDKSVITVNNLLLVVSRQIPE